MSNPGLIGATIGNYEVRALLGSGGMASVYRGFDPNLQRAVAIKVLSPAAAALPGFADRFRQEARLIANLRHPNIVQVYDFGDHLGRTYMVQELLPGPTLEQRMADLAASGTQMPSQEIISIVNQLAGALDAAHAAGVIHRDVKPANALWNAAGALVLTDFGIAKNTVAPVNQTQVGVVMGTPAYMSPEQAQGLPLTPASDIYALGVVLYELIADRVPFEGATPMGVVLQHIQTPPPPLRPLRSNVPPAVEAVVLRALDKNPAARFRTATELAQALQHAWTRVPATNAAPIHSQPTHVWSPGPAQRPAHPGAGGPRAQLRPAASVAPLPARAPRRQSHRLLPLLGGLLVLLLLGGAFLALRGGGMATGQTTPAQPTDVAAQGEAPAGVAAPTPVAVMPLTPSTPIAQLRKLLADGASDGRVRQSDGFIAALEASQQALERGDTAQAKAQLSDLQKQLLRAVPAGHAEPQFVREALTGISAVARSAELTLPLSVTSD